MEINELLRIKCQREFVVKARIAQSEAKDGGAGGSSIKRRLEGGPAAGSVEDEMRRK